MSEVVVRAQEISWEISQELIQEISLRPYRATCLLRDHAGGLLLRVLAKEAQKRKEPPVSLLMVYPDVSLYDEARGYAGSIEAYVGLGLEGLTTAGDFIIICFSHETLGLGSSAGDQLYHRLAVVSGGEAPCPCPPIAYWDNPGRSASPRRRHGALRPSVLR
jgi:hypothetical protein